LSYMCSVRLLPDDAQPEVERARFADGSQLPVCRPSWTQPAAGQASFEFRCSSGFRI
jgi:hypothetical protein